MTSRHIARCMRACATQAKPVRSTKALPPLSDAVAQLPSVGNQLLENPSSLPKFAELQRPAKQAEAASVKKLDAEIFAGSDCLHPLQTSYLDLPSPPFLRDEGQVDAVMALMPIYDKLMQPLKVKAPAPQVQRQVTASGGGGLFSFFGSAKPNPKPAPKPQPAKFPAEARGMYFHGKPGTGKTVMLDLFYRSLPADFPARRLHWHEFIGQGMRYLSTFKKTDANDDLYVKLAQALVPRCRVLLLDELVITHISEAMFVKQLFRALWARGTVVITTSNYKHDELYAGGFNRSEFLPFIPELTEMCPLFDLSNPTDYRSIDVVPTGCFLTPVSEATVAMLEAQFLGMVSKPEACEIVVEGRPIPVPASGTDANGGQVARFHFNDLCGKPRGRAEYAALATRFHSIFIDEIPKLNADTGAEFCRLVSLVDILYDKKCILHCTSEVPMPEIWDVPESSDNVDEMWAWRRTRAKLTEMASLKYVNMASLLRNHLVQSRATEL